MAPALTSSNPFLTSTTTARRTTKHHHLHRTSKLPPPPPKLQRSTIVCAKQDAFKFGRKSEASGDADAADGRPKPFFFDFNGKLPDAKSLVTVISPSSKSLFATPRRKDPNTVFVAGATGVAGARITQTLLRQGFAVRAGVPDLASAQELARLAAKYKVISPEESKRLNAVEATFDDAEAIAKAIGSATKVVVTIGPAENGASAEVTTDAALEVVEAAQLAGASHIVVVYDAGGSIFGAQSTGNVLDGLNAFFSNLSSLFSKRQPLTIGEFLAKVAETDVNYTLIKTALADDFASEASYGVVVAGEGSGGAAAAAAADEYKVPRTKIASLVAGVLSNTSVAENKVVEVSTSPSAPPKGIEDLFSTIQEDGRRAAYREALAKAKEEEAALILASEKAQEAAEATRKPEKQASKPKKLQQARAAASSTEDQPPPKAEIPSISLEGLFGKAKDLGGEFSFDKLSSQFAAVAKLSAKEEESEGKTQIATVRGRAKAQKLPPQKAVVKKAAPPPPKPKPKQQPEVKPEVRKVFGGLFQQETIYIDD